MFGQILTTIVAIAVTLLTGSPTLGNVVSQGFAVLTGIQDKFDWKSVGQSALREFVLTGGPKLGVIPAAIAEAATQGIEIAVGLRSKIDFAGVAVAGATAGFDAALGSPFKTPTTRLGQFGQALALNTARGLVSAAARSAINGDSFGDSLKAQLPSILASTAQSFAIALQTPLAAKTQTHGTANTKAGAITNGQQAPAIATASANTPTAGTGGGQNLYIDDATGEKRLYLIDPGETVYDLRTADNHLFGPATIISHGPALWEIGADGYVHPSTSIETANANIAELNRETASNGAIAHPAEPAAGEDPRFRPGETADIVVTGTRPTPAYTGGYDFSVFASVASLNLSLPTFSRPNYSGPDRRWDLPDNTPQWRAYTATDRINAYERARSDAFWNADEDGIGAASFMYNYGGSPEQIAAAGRFQGAVTAIAGAAYVSGAGRRAYAPPSNRVTTSFSIRGSVAAETKLAGGTFDLGLNGSQYTLKSPTIAGFERTTGTVNTRAFIVHGNSAASLRTAYLYELYLKDGTFLKMASPRISIPATQSRSWLTRISSALPRDGERICWHLNDSALSPTRDRLISNHMQ